MNKPKVFVFGLAVTLLAGISVSADEVRPASVQHRWEFVVTSGDTSAQLAESGLTSFSTFLSQRESQISSLPLLNSDTSICDQLNSDNVVISGNVTNGTNVSLTFAVSNGNAPGFTYQFNGTFTRAFTQPITQNGRTQQSRPITAISGTYTVTGACAASHGTFVATALPGFGSATLDNLYLGFFDAPDLSSVPDTVPSAINVVTKADDSLAGSITGVQLNANGQPIINRRTGRDIPDPNSPPAMKSSAGVACFASPLKILSGQSNSFAAGIQVEMLSQDSVGTQMFVASYSANEDDNPETFPGDPNPTLNNGSAAAVGEDIPADGFRGTINDGTNIQLSVFYFIVGGPCDGASGNGSPFLSQSIGRLPISSNSITAAGITRGTANSSVNSSAIVEEETDSVATPEIASAPIASRGIAHPNRRLVAAVRRHMQRLHLKQADRLVLPD